MTKGAGAGAGFTGDGSQTAGGDGISSSGTAAAGSGSVTSGTAATSASSSAAANPGVVVPFDSRAVYMGAILLVSFLGGGLLL